MDIPPLTLILILASGEPSAVVAVTPAKRPFKTSAAVFAGMSLKSLALTEETDAITSFLLTD